MRCGKASPLQQDRQSLGHFKDAVQISCLDLAIAGNCAIAAAIVQLHERIVQALTLANAGMDFIAAHGFMRV